MCGPRGLGVPVSIGELDPVSFVDQSTLTPSADFIATGMAILLEEFLLDGNWTRFALLVTAPFLFCVSLVRHTPSSPADPWANLKHPVLQPSD